MEENNIEIQLREEQRYGRLKKTTINHTYINGGEYRKKFDTITESANLNRLLHRISKEMLIHRSGTLYEDMYWIDAEKEEILCCKTDETVPQQISHSDILDKKIAKCNSIIALHTHPYSLPPSADDFNCFLEYNYKLGLVICHDGTIYAYLSLRKIDLSLWEKYCEVEFNTNEEQ